jgi:hypothetical protein
MNLLKLIIILTSLILSVPSYANNESNPKQITNAQQDKGRYNAAKKIAEIAKEVKEDSVSKFGINPIYENRYSMKRDIQDNLLGELKGCYALFMNRELSDNEKNHFQINKIEFGNPRYEGFKINEPNKRDNKEQQAMCVSLTKNPIKMSCSEEFIDENPYKKKVPEFKGPLSNTEELLKHLPYQKEEGSIFYKELTGTRIKTIQKCQLNEDLKKKNITTKFETYFVQARQIGQLTPYVDLVYKDKEMYQIDIEYIPITSKEYKTTKITTITIRMQDLTIKENIQKLIDEISLLFGLIAFLAVSFISVL